MKWDDLDSLLVKKKDYQTSMRVNSELWDKLKEVAQDSGINMSSAISLAIYILVKIFEQNKD